MGLPGHFSYCSTESIPILLVELIAKFISYLLSRANAVFHSLGFFKSSDRDDMERALISNIGYNLGILSILTEQMIMNAVMSKVYGFTEGETKGSDSCAVCLCCLRKGQRVRMLECHHVFHMKCLDRWFEHLNFNCPLCRTSVVSEERVAEAHRKGNIDAVANLRFH